VLTNKTTKGRMDGWRESYYDSAVNFTSMQLRWGSIGLRLLICQSNYSCDLTGGADNQMSLWERTIAKICDSTIAL